MSQVHLEIIEELEAKIEVLKEENEYLKAFYCEADFGPAHEDVVSNINSRILADGIIIPEGWLPEEE